MIDPNKFTGAPKELAKRIRTLEEGAKARLTFASDTAEELFLEHDVPAHLVEGTGSGGAVAADDVRAAARIK